VLGGTVYLVPAADVETLSETPINLFLSPEDTAALELDEPIEDLIDANGGSYEQAEVDTSGVYRFETLPEGSYFVVWMPAGDDTLHFPGGSSSSAALDTSQLVGMQLDIQVSSRPSATDRLRRRSVGQHSDSGRQWFRDAPEGVGSLSRYRGQH